MSAQRASCAASLGAILVVTTMPIVIVWALLKTTWFIQKMVYGGILRMIEKLKKWGWKRIALVLYGMGCCVDRGVNQYTARVLFPVYSRLMVWSFNIDQKKGLGIWTGVDSKTREPVVSAWVEGKKGKKKAGG